MDISTKDSKLPASNIGNKKPEGELCKKSVWSSLYAEGVHKLNSSSYVSFLYQDHILSHENLDTSLAWKISKAISSTPEEFYNIYHFLVDIYRDNQSLGELACSDLLATFNKDPACKSIAQAYLFYKGFIAIQIHRLSHNLYSTKFTDIAYYLQSKCSEVYSVDIHPAAKFGSGIFLDHAHSIVIGETSTIGNNVSILHSVTLGGKGNGSGDRHPKIGSGVVLGAGSTILGNISIGDNSVIGAGAVVLDDIPANSTAVGVPASLCNSLAPS
ncbi:serine O-acetyltransferase [Thalassolituus maritimus]|uniref:Serine acetyltransferase n=1 Tax=Thalassolituus maritimus TaxID=484498 RepID=A0A1N7IYN0_9GAMM|nr:serine O-acetyltransferase [Thalassolituus maritimus]SIS42096.1 serine O-acetyltransferase [Thalassolituus maritimus]